MNWTVIKDAAWFAFIFLLAITLIENDGDTLLVEMAGDVFGALALIYLAAERALREPSDPTV